MEKYFFLHEWVIGGGETLQTLKDENGDAMIFKSRVAAESFLTVLRAHGYYTKGYPIPHNHKIEASENQMRVREQSSFAIKGDSLQVRGCWGQFFVNSSGILM